MRYLNYYQKRVILQLSIADVIKDHTLSKPLHEQWVTPTLLVEMNMGMMLIMMEHGNFDHGMANRILADLQSMPQPFLVSWFTLSSA